MKANLKKPKKRKVLTEQECAERKAKRLKEKEAKMQEQLSDLKQGYGWSSDIVLARHFNVSRQRIWIWAKEGKLPSPYKVGEATTRWKNEEVQEAECKNFLEIAS